MWDSLQSENESIQLKVAMYIVEKMEKRDIRETDFRIMLRKQCTKNPLIWDFPEDFNEGKYEVPFRRTTWNIEMTLQNEKCLSWEILHWGISYQIRYPPLTGKPKWLTN